MVKAVFSAMLMDKIWAESMIFQPMFRLLQQVPNVTSSALTEICTFMPEIFSKTVTVEARRKQCSCANSKGCCSCVILKIVLCQ